MCFSPEVSFTAAVALGITGIMTLKNTTSRSQFFLAAIPFLFAIQQFAEGLSWLHLSYNVGSPENFKITKQTFLFFAFLIWPIWIPLAFFMVEKIAWRRYVMLFLLIGGVVLTTLHTYYAMKIDTSAKIVNHSIQYNGAFPNHLFLYTTIVVLPCLISSLKNIWIYSILVLISFLIAAYFYQTTFISVWCFFAAVMSLSIYKILKDNKTAVEKDLLKMK